MPCPCCWSSVPLRGAWLVGERPPVGRRFRRSREIKILLCGFPEVAPPQMLLVSGSTENFPWLLRIFAVVHQILVPFFVRPHWLLVVGPNFLIGRSNWGRAIFVAT